MQSHSQNHCSRIQWPVPEMIMYSIMLNAQVEKEYYIMQNKTKIQHTKSHFWCWLKETHLQGCLTFSNWLFEVGSVFFFCYFACVVRFVYGHDVFWIPLRPLKFHAIHVPFCKCQNSQFFFETWTLKPTIFIKIVFSIFCSLEQSW